MLKFIVEFPMKINQKSISYYTLGYFLYHQDSLLDGQNFLYGFRNRVVDAGFREGCCEDTGQNATRRKDATSFVARNN